jgi:hypothetical protein
MATVTRKRGPPAGAKQQLYSEVDLLLKRVRRQREKIVIAAASLSLELLPSRSLICGVLLSAYKSSVQQFEDLLGWSMLVQACTVIVHDCSRVPFLLASCLALLQVGPFF